MKVGTAWIDVDGNLKPFDRSIDRAGSRMRSRFSAIGKTAALGFGAGLAGAAVATKGFLEAQIESEKSSARMRAQLKASGKSYARHGDQIDRVIRKQSRLAGLDDEDLQDAFTNIVRTTGDVDEALRLVAVASDIARAKNMDVAKAGELVGKVAGGNTGILSRYGIVLDKGASSTEALASLQQKFAGQAEAYGKTTAGSVDRLDVAWENVKETLGSAVAPAFERLATGAGNIVSEIDRIAQRKDIDVSEKIRLSVEVLKKRFEPIKREAEQALRNAAPGIQAAAGTIARKAAGAFIKAWLASDWWVKVFTGLYLAKKLGVFHSLGKSAGTKFGKSFAKWGTPLIIGAIASAVFDKQIHSAAKSLADLITGKPPKGFETPEKADATLRRQGQEAGRQIRRDELMTPAIVLGTDKTIPISDPRHPHHKWWVKAGKPSRHSGGPIPGRGDQLWNLKGGEHVMNTRAVKRMGHGFFDALNAGTSPAAGSSGPMYGDIHNHFVTPSGDMPDARYVGAQLEQELRRRGRGQG